MTERPRTESELRARLAELDAKIAAAPGWGAAVGARSQQRREIKSKLAALDAQTRIVRDPEKARILSELQGIRAGVNRLQESLEKPSVTPIAPTPSVRTARRWWEFWL